MTLYLSLRCGDVSITRTLDASPLAPGGLGTLQDKVVALVTRVIAMAKAVEEMPA